ncbi:MAG TPA: fumarylacetoacetate hydrolase family protein [Fibrobacteria bacterium]|nr:fumarylacetoacetate hydrolase family protein [Fibrobacteria bacterium]
MKWIRFRFGGKTLCGRLNADGTASPLLGSHPDEPFFPLDPAFSEERIPVDRLLAPILPVDILGIGLNYKEHAKEGHSESPPVPLLFIKAGSCLNHPGAPIPVPRLSTQVDFEGELAVIIGRTAKDVSRSRALEHVFGYTCANDVTARDWQRDKNLGGGQFARGKSFDGFCPLGPWIVTADEVPDPGALWIRTYVNGVLMQDQGTSDMIFDVPALIESLSSTMTLRPGTVILTGTPSGVGFARTPPVWLKPGDRVRIDIEGIGSLENPVSAA